MSIKKKRIDQSGATGIRATAAGYATKARHDPEEATSSTPTPSSVARKPRMLKMTNPAKTEVEQLAVAIMMASLESGKNNKFKVESQSNEHQEEEDGPVRHHGSVPRPLW